MSTSRRLWIALVTLLAATFAVLLWMGSEIARVEPPMPERVVAQDGQVLFTRADIEQGRIVWQSIGGQQMGTVWGHGALVAPDWSADWLHREALALLDTWAQRDRGMTFAQLDPAAQEQLKVRLRLELRRNTYDAANATISVSADRAAAIAAVAGHYASLFSDDSATQSLRETYAMRNNAVDTAEHRAALARFFFWTAWAAGTERPGAAITYTNNWPYEPLVGNAPPPSTLVWSVFSVVFMIAGIGLMAWHYAGWQRNEPPLTPPPDDPLRAITVTPSMRATAKYFWVVLALLLTQILLGAITAHYQVEGQRLYGLDLSAVLPYSLTRSWHTELAVLWIATAWLATGLYIAPAVSGHEPKFQRIGVNFLFVCLLIIVVGSMAGQWFAIQQRLGFITNFWFGHQGFEYVDLGRFWQLFLFVGLFVWLALMARAMWPAISRPSESRHLLLLFFLSCVAIAAFYGAGLMWGRRTNLAISEYWRWWVVHLWVEGFFEVFATTVIAFLFTRMGLLKTASATAAVLFATSIFLAGGIVGTFHHLYFTGTTTPILALGSVFSAMEIVPLTLIGFEEYENLKLSRSKHWVAAYKWPIYFFIAVAFWNLVGAGLFGFLINPPIALYYMQGLNTTAVHGHTALFGVYGMLGIGLMLFCLKGLSRNVDWKEGNLKFAFWSINIGLAAMVLLSLLPVGIAQAIASIDKGMWYARSAEFMQQDYLQTLRWMRAIGDSIFAAGIVALGIFVLGLKTGWSIRPPLPVKPSPRRIVVKTAPQPAELVN
jgi:nitric oxide reductase subunit B